MQIRDTTKTFGIGSRAFHWVMAATMLVGGLIGYFMPEVESGDPRTPILDLHTGIGLAVFLLAALRVIWRLFNPTPAPVPGTPPLHALAAKLAHISLYGLMFAIPITGCLMTWAEGRSLHMFWLHDIAPPFARDSELGAMLEISHNVVVILLILAVFAHAGAALWHHFIVRDATLRRMLTGAAD